MSSIIVAFIMDIGINYIENIVNMSIRQRFFWAKDSLKMTFEDMPYFYGPKIQKKKLKKELFDLWYIKRTTASLLGHVILLLLLSTLNLKRWKIDGTILWLKLYFLRFSHSICSFFKMLIWYKFSNRELEKCIFQSTEKEKWVNTEISSSGRKSIHNNKNI